MFSGFTVTISFSAILGAILGYFIFRNRALGGGWGALLGAILLPLAIWLISLAVNIQPTTPAAVTPAP